MTYEYIVEFTYENGREFEKTLNTFGDQGWKLCGYSVRSNDDGQFRECVFMREVED